ncbi:hypothetical protein GCM10009850_118110 [Nonomuraea monospora]|uniref:Uncharacterized protein n=1 Tax=Nonomuraea monospora TaxID=568818 RepID=A0ABN3D3B3_9ACTN
MKLETLHGVACGFVFGLLHREHIVGEDFPYLKQPGQHVFLGNALALSYVLLNKSPVGDAALILQSPLCIDAILLASTVSKPHSQEGHDYGGKSSPALKVVRQRRSTHSVTSQGAMSGTL